MRSQELLANRLSERKDNLATSIYFCAGERGIRSSLTGQISKKLNHLKIKATCVIQNCWHFSDNCPQRCQEWLYKLRVSLAINSTVNAAVQQLLSLKAWHVLNSSVSGDGDALCHFPRMHLSPSGE